MLQYVARRGAGGVVSVAAYANEVSESHRGVLQCVAACCSVLKGVAACCNV